MKTVVFMWKCRESDVPVASFKSAMSLAVVLIVAEEVKAAAQMAVVVFAMVADDATVAMTVSEH